LRGVFLVQTLVAILFPPYATAWLNHWFGLVPLGPIPGLRFGSRLPTSFFTRAVASADQYADALDVGRELELVWVKKRFLNYFFICGVAQGLSPSL